MIERKNILIISCTPFYGGGEVFIQRLLPHLDKYHVYVYVKNDRLNLEIKESFTFFFPAATFISDVKNVRGIIAKYHISLVILNGNRAIYLAPFLPFNVKIVAYKHTGSPSVPMEKRYIYSILNYICLLRSNWIICVSKAIFNDILFFKNKKVIIYNGLPQNFFPEFVPDKSVEILDSDILNIVFVGRIESSKGIWETVKSIEKCGGRCRLYLLGEGDEAENVEHYLNEKKIENIIMLGQVNNVSDFLSKSHFFILPSYYEAFGFSIIEAMAYGLPVISTNVGAIPEIVRHNIDGILVPPRDIDSLYHALIYLSDNKDVRHLMGRNARKRVKECFMLDSSIKKIQNLLDQICI